MKISIKLKFIAFLAALLVTALGVLSFLVLKGIKQDQLSQMEATLQRQTEFANLQVNQAFYTGETRDAQKFLTARGQELARTIGTYSGLPVILYHLTGKEAGNSVPFTSRPDTSALLPYALKNKSVYQTEGAQVYYLAPVMVAGEQAGVVEFHYSLASQRNFYFRIRNLLLTIGAAVLVASFVFGYLYFSRFAKSVVKLKGAAVSIQQGRYIAEPPMRSRDELGDLSQGIYYMSREIQRNITGMQEEQHKLQLAVAKLQALEQQQKQFIGNISHEFKTPLTSIKAYVDLMGMYKDDPKLVDEGVLNIGKEAERLHEMVDKALHLTALEKYDFEEQAEAVELRELLTDIAGRMNGKVEKFGLRLELGLQPVVVWADKESLMHIFVNLLDNAIKYNKPGGVIRIDSRPEGDWATVDVRNTGPGIPPASREKIFEPFYTVNKDRSRQSGGTGLGLSIVKQLIGKQNGSIELLQTEPGPDSGDMAGPWTTFRIKLHLQE
ncbi:sensor histidine kinase [Paenibacillus gansuensis]|uniref:histidine kinase n=1 Tax=Paenibacillus gansuensis TaxID=306542 RepID=A0ABW5PL47_9BACL